MHSYPTISREQLQAIPGQNRLTTIHNYIHNHIYQAVRGAASAGKTSYLYVLPKPDPFKRTQPQIPEYVVTTSDIVEGLHTTFPGCTITYSEEWVDVRPGVREQQSGILIDWS